MHERDSLGGPSLGIARVRFHLRSIGGFRPAILFRRQLRFTQLQKEPAQVDVGSGERGILQTELYLVILGDLLQILHGDL